MKTEKTSKEGRLEFFKELYERARLAAEECFEALDKSFEQYRGSLKIDGSEEDALTVRNITYEIVESQVSSEIPLPKVEPDFYAEGREQNARAIELLCSAVRDRLPFEEMNDIDERRTYIYGGSVWLIEWDDSRGGAGERGGIRISAVSPKDFIPEPCIRRVEDMEYCFVRFTATRGDVQRKYRISDEKLTLLECEYSYESYDSESDAVTVITCFYKDEAGEVGIYTFSGEVTLSDVPEYYKRKTSICLSCGRPADECECGGELAVCNVESEQVMLSEEEAYRLLGVRRELQIEIPYYVPRRFPIVVRKNTSTGDSLLGQSDCEYIRPEQQAINKIESRILQKLLRAGITPIIPEDASVSLNNSVFGQVIRMKPGENADMYGTVDTTPDVSQDVAEADRLYDHSKRILGISDAYQGIDNASAESGYAKQLRISQANGRLESKRRMKKAAYADIYRIIFELYLAFADEPRAVSYEDTLGTLRVERFDRRDFISLDGLSGAFYYDDAYRFSADSGEEEYSHESLWEKNLENLKSGSLGNPDEPKTLLRYWQNQERAHYPYARENVEYFKALLSAPTNERN